ncbi:MAG TPA: methane monooxygenase/ammonia monooxygenase subunit B [Nitrososphaeraceae archaeon]|jgi:methane/ammonia monooxygenase subunit B|nr:methane monooxygenase/ammonia monooxygenase subunit B [Nitrososphaeraceae archaeon]
MSKIYIFVVSGLVKNKDMMESKTLAAIALATIIAVSVISYILPSASAHGVQAQLQSRFVRIDNEQFSDQTLQTGEDLTVTGELTSLVNRPLRAWLSLFSESSNAGNRWEFLARDPPGNIFDIPPGTTIPYSITVRALEPGTYHVHTQLNVETVGPGLGRGATVSVTGEPILKPIPYSNIVYQCIIIGVGLGVTFATRPWQVI